MFGRVAGGRWTRARTTPLASAAPSCSAVAGVAAQPTPAGTPDPTAPAHPVAHWSPAGPRRCAAWLPLPAANASLGGVYPPAPASAAAAATSPDEAGHDGSSRTCHLRSNHRAYLPAVQADPGLDPPPSSAPPRPPTAGPGWSSPATPSSASLGASPTTCAVPGRSPRPRAASPPPGSATWLQEPPRRTTLRRWKDRERDLTMTARQSQTG